MSGLDERLKSAKDQRREEPDGASFGTFMAKDGGAIRYGLFPLPNGEKPKGTVIFVPGRTEFIEKFYEDIYLWHSFGYACAGIDLRGQGLSHREHLDRDKHFVKTFDTHLTDIQQLFEDVLTQKEADGITGPFILMGHSAGSHTILRFLSEHPGYAEKAITVAPMAGIGGDGTPTWSIKFVASLMILFGRGDNYVPGHTKFKEGRWGWRKRLTHDDDRFCDEDHFIKTKDRDLAVGGATFKWVREAIRSCEKLMTPSYGARIETPVLMLQAGEDVIVDNSAQTTLAGRMPACKLVHIEGAMHEILKERDEKRRLVWDAIVDFMALDSSS